MMERRKKKKNRCRTIDNAGPYLKSKTLLLANPLSKLLLCARHCTLYLSGERLVALDGDLGILVIQAIAITATFLDAETYLRPDKKRL